jgi:hypothetical protein
MTEHSTDESLPSRSCDRCGFPRWDEAGRQQAFEVTDWQFDGLFSEALSEVDQRS